MLADIDVLVIDLQDVGSRYYTLSGTGTLHAGMHEAGKNADRARTGEPPRRQPRGRPVENDSYESFVDCGRCPVPTA